MHWKMHGPRFSSCVVMKKTGQKKKHPFAQQKKIYQG